MDSQHRPDDETIEDDEALDKYMEALARQIARQARRSAPSGSSSPSLSLLGDSKSGVDALPTWEPGQ